MTVKTITLNEVVIPKMNEYIAKINTRAQKMGQAHLEAVEVSREVVRVNPERDINPNTLVEDSFITMVTFEIHGETPKINGWTFIARIEHDLDLGSNFLRVAPGQTLPRQYWEAPCNCDHCGTKRNRLDTFVLREEATGEYKQIGRQCVRDFIGYDNPADMFWWTGVVDAMISDSDSWGSGVRTNPLYSVERVLQTAAAAVKLFGYRSRKMVEEGRATMATSGYISDTYMRFPMGTPQYVKDIIAEANSAESAATAKVVMDWVAGWDDTTKNKSEFNFNVSTLFAKDLCRGKDFGILACLHTMYLREQDMLVANVVRSNLHVGEVGQKIEVCVTIKNVVAMQGFYGVTHMVLMEDEAGNMFKWIASNLGDFNKGDVVTIKGTIKAHEEYKGRNQTTMTRCKLAIVKG
jgi:hypothetical protein